MSWRYRRDKLESALADFVALDLRRSYFYIAGLVVAGFIVNLFLPHGWTVWPIVMVIGILLMVDEAADRNGTGVPPLRVYALALVTLALWLLGALALSALNLYILAAGILLVVYFASGGVIRQREIDRQVAHRRKNGLCVFCGQLCDPRLTFCPNCGQEPNPESARRERVNAVSRTPQAVANSRRSLKPVHNQDVKTKEQALLARRKRVGPRRRGSSGAQ